MILHIVAYRTGGGGGGGVYIYKKGIGHFWEHPIQLGLIITASADARFDYTPINFIHFEGMLTSLECAI